MKNKIYLIRGVSGSGKTTLAKTLEQSLSNCIAIAADDFWLENGEYKFDATYIHNAHNWCKQQVELNMIRFTHNIIIHNIFTSEKELIPYRTSK